MKWNCTGRVAGHQVVLEMVGDDLFVMIDDDKDVLRKQQWQKFLFMMMNEPETMDLKPQQAKENMEAKLKHAIGKSRTMEFNTAVKQTTR